MKFSDKVYYLRMKRGLTQAELARLANISQQSIAHFEKDRGRPQINTQIQLAKVLGVKVDDLMNDERSIEQ